MGGRGSRLGTVSDERLRADVAVQLHLARKGQGDNSAVGKKNREVLLKAFSSVDTNQDGTLSFDEFCRVAEDAGLCRDVGVAREVKLREAFARFDRDHNGWVEFEEVMDFMCPLKGLDLGNPQDEPEGGALGIGLHMGRSSPKLAARPFKARPAPKSTRPKAKAKRAPGARPKSSSRPHTPQSPLIDVAEPTFNFPTKSPTAHGDALAKVANTVYNTEQKLQDAFNEFDADGSGSLDAEEFHKALKSIGVQANKTAALGLFRAVSDGSKMSCESFCQALSSVEPAIAEKAAPTRRRGSRRGSRSSSSSPSSDASDSSDEGSMLNSEGEAVVGPGERERRAEHDVAPEGLRFALEEPESAPASVEDSAAEGPYPAKAKAKGKSSAHGSRPGIAPEPPVPKSAPQPHAHTRSAPSDHAAVEVEAASRSPPRRAPKRTGAETAAAGAVAPEKHRATPKEKAVSPAVGKTASAGRRQAAKARGAQPTTPEEEGEELYWSKGPRLLTAAKPKAKAATAATEDQAAEAGAAPKAPPKAPASQKASPPPQPRIAQYGSKQQDLIAAELSHEVRNLNEKKGAQRPQADRSFLGVKTRGGKVPSDDDSDGDALWAVAAKQPESEEPEEEPDEDQASSYVAAARPFEIPRANSNGDDKKPGAKALDAKTLSSHTILRDESGALNSTTTSGLQAEASPRSPGQEQSVTVPSSRKKPGVASAVDTDHMGGARQGSRSMELGRRTLPKPAQETAPEPSVAPVPLQRKTSADNQPSTTSKRKALAPSAPKAASTAGEAQAPPLQKERSTNVDFQQADASRSSHRSLPVERQRSQQQQQQLQQQCVDKDDAVSPKAKPIPGSEKKHVSQPRPQVFPHQAGDDEAPRQLAEPPAARMPPASATPPASEPEPVPSAPHQEQQVSDAHGQRSSNEAHARKTAGAAEDADEVADPTSRVEDELREVPAEEREDLEEARRRRIEEDKAREAAWLQADAADRRRKQEARAKNAGTLSQNTWAYGRRASAKRAPSPPPKAAASSGDPGQAALSKTLPAKPKGKSSVQTSNPLSKTAPTDSRVQLQPQRQQQQQQQQQQQPAKQIAAASDPSEPQGTPSCPAEQAQARDATSATRAPEPQQQAAATAAPAPSRSTSRKDALPRAASPEAIAASAFSASQEETGLTAADAAMLAELAGRLREEGLTAAQVLSQCAPGAIRSRPGTGRVQGRTPGVVDAAAFQAFIRQLQYSMPEEMVSQFLRRARMSLDAGSSGGSVGATGLKARGAESGVAACTIDTTDFLALLNVVEETRTAAAGQDQAGGGEGSTKIGSRYIPAAAAGSQSTAAQLGARRAPDRKKRRLKRRMQALSEQEKALAAHLQGILFGPRSTLESVFRSLDKNKDGAVSCEDFLIALEHAGIAVCDGSGHHLPDSAVSGDEVADMLAFFDRDGDGLLKYEEFLQFLESAGRQIDGSELAGTETAGGPQGSDSESGSLRGEAQDKRVTAEEENEEEEEEYDDDTAGDSPSRFLRRKGEVSMPLRRMRRRAPRRSRTDIDADMESPGKGRTYLPSHYSGAPQESVQFVRVTLGVSKRGRALGDMDKVSRAFEKWDHDGDGTISEDELFRVLNMLDSRFTVDSAHRLFQAADANRDGVIDYQEFIAWLFQKP